MARTQRSIQAFAKVSKPSSDVPGSRKRKQIVDEEEPIRAITKKVKVQLETPPDTPTKVIKHALSNLKLSIPTPSILNGSKRKRAASLEVETPPTPESNDDNDAIDEDEPEVIEDLKALNASFLKAIALHYAHNGAASPVDVRFLTPTVTKTWGKRKVAFDDIRVCLGVTYSGNSKISTTFSVSNYGNGKFCIERESRQRKRGILAQAFNECELLNAFEKELDVLWQAWPQKAETEQFLASLPRTQISECSSYTKLKPTLAKGQQRLDEVLGPRSTNMDGTSKRPQIRLFPAYEKPSSLKAAVSEDVAPRREKENTTPPPPTVNFRAMSLLDRIQQKQETQAANAANKPSQASLERLAALQRLEEMVQILELLATTKGPGFRASFPLPGLIRSIQSSLRSPMSTEEIERCIVVIGKEVAPGYVEKKVFGSMKGVVVNRMFKPDAEKLRQIVESASN